MHKRIGLAIIVANIIGLILSLAPVYGHTTELVLPSYLTQPTDAAISADGQTVAFEATVTVQNGSPCNATQVFAIDRRTGTVEHISENSDGIWANNHCGHPTMSGDGRFVAFIGIATNMGATTVHDYTLFVRDRKEKTTECASIALDSTAVDLDGYHPAISLDGRFVAFESRSANIVDGCTGGTSQIYIHDRLTNTTQSIPSSIDGREGDFCGSWPSLSANGRFVAFCSNAGHSDPGVSAIQICVHDRQTKETHCVSVSNDGMPGNGGSFSPSISGDGRFVAFESDSSNLVAGMQGSQVYVHDRQNGSTRCISRTSDSTQAYKYNSFPCLSANGRYVAFRSNCDTVVPGYCAGIWQTYLNDMLTGMPEYLSVNEDGIPCDTGAGASEYFVSGDGRFSVFTSNSPDLVSGTYDLSLKKLFLHDRGQLQNILIAGTSADGHVFYTASSSGLRGIPGSMSQVIVGNLYKYGVNDLVGLKPDGSVWYSIDEASWKQIPGYLASIVLGDFGGFGLKGIAGLAADGSIWYSTDLSTWQNIPGRLNSIVTGNFAGKGKDGIAGLSSNGTIWYSGDLSTWKQIPGHLSKIRAADLDMDAVDDLIGIASDGTIWYTTDRQNWTNIPGRLADIVVGNFTGAGVSIAGRASDGSVWYTTDKQTWTQIPGRLQSITVVDFDGWDEIAGTSADGQIWYTKNLHDWIKIPGTLSTLHSDRY